MRTYKSGFLLHVLVLAAAALLGPVTAAAQRADSARAWHLLQRATFGARPEDLAEILRRGESAWLERQLHPERIDDAALEQRLARFPAERMSVAELYDAFPPPRPVPQNGVRPDSLSPELRRMRAMQNPVRIVEQLAGAKLTRAVYSERQLEEVMTDFWFNHFNVFFNKGPVRWLVVDYERSAIRPHVFGRFEELLRATAAHPAMLVYLDNFQSSAPADGAAAARLPRGRSRGLNENYARELLELHTLGVDGGYTQQDVVEVARAFTGWTITRPGGRGRPGMAMDDGGARAIAFVFRPQLHDRGEKRVLGRTLAEGRGREDGEDVLRLLARHPSTARHLATKLAQHFVADEPPAALVDELARVFLDKDGDLRALTRALFASRHFYDPAHYGAKVKTPFELVASALRVTNAELLQPRGVLQTLRGLGNVPYLQSAPTGYPTAAEDWINAGAMLSRMNFALALSEGRLPGVRIPVTTASATDALSELWTRIGTPEFQRK